MVNITYIYHSVAAYSYHSIIPFIMKTTTKLNAIFTVIIIVVILLNFGCKKVNSAAERVKIGNDELVVCDIYAITDTVTVPLSSLIEKLEIIRLDTARNALFQSATGITISEKYIGLSLYRPMSFKLFDRNGKYIRQIGSEGHGPSEYTNISDAQISEANGEIYILPWSSDKILRFGIEGNAREPIMFPAQSGSGRYNSPKGKFNVNPNGTVSVATLPMGRTLWGWIQDREGNFLAKAELKSKINVDFSSEISVSKNMGKFDPFMMIYGSKTNDTLFQFDYSEKRLVPRFTVKNIMDKKPPYYSYSEIPGYFLGEYSPGMVRVSETSSYALPPKKFMINKKTLEGKYYNIVLDEFGDMPLGWYSFSEDYFIYNSSAIGLKTILKEHLELNIVKDKATIDKLQKLHDSIDEENDNNIIFLGKLKK